MKRFFSQLFIVATFATVLSSCGGGDSMTPEQLLPKDANLVLTIDLPSIGSKGLPRNKVLEMSGAEQGEHMQFIDTASKMYLFGKPGANFEEGYMALTIGLKDQEGFLNAMKAQVAEMEGKEVSIEKIDEAKISYLKTDDYILAAKGGVALAYIQAELTEENPLEQIKKLYSLSEENSLNSGENHFTRTASKGYDMAIWFNIEEIVSIASEVDSRAGLVNAALNLEDTYVGGGIRFENGQIVIESQLSTNEEMKKLADGFISKKGLSKTLLDALPGDDVLAAGSYSFNPKALLSFLETTSYAKMLDQASAGLGMGMDKITGMFTGEIGYTFNGFKVEKGMSEEELQELSEELGMDPEELAEMQEDESKTTPRFSVVIGINPGNELNMMWEGMILKKDVEAMAEGEKNEGWTELMPGSFVTKKQQYIQLVSPADLKGIVEKGEHKSLPKELRDKLSKNAVYHSWHVGNIVKALIGSGQMGVDLSSLGNMADISPITTIDATLTNEDGLVGWKATISMKNQEKNSLKFLMETFEKFEQMAKFMM